MNIENTDFDTATAGQPPTLVPLSACHLSPRNPRQSVTDAEIAALAESLKAVGLLQNLIGWQPAPDRTEIVAGGRRLRALQLIVSEGEIDPDSTDVPVLLAEDEDAALRLAASETFARHALHPADEVAAYRDMIEAGLTIPDIAKAFAVTERHVRGRLRLANLADPILAALRANEITLDVAAAYTVCADPKTQTAVFEQLLGSWGSDNPKEIRRRLTEGKVSHADKLAKFVGREAYEAAGGTTREDLFGETSLFEDPDLLRGLAEAKLSEAATAFRVEGWSWVEQSFEHPGYEALQPLPRLYPELVELREGDAESYDVQAGLIEVGVASDEDEAAFEALSAEENRVAYTEDQKAHAGVFLWIDYKGEVQKAAGYIRPEDIDTAETAGIYRKPKQLSVAKTRTPRGPYSQALANDLALIRTGTLQAALLEDPDLALDLLAFTLTTPLRLSAKVLGISLDAPKNGPNDDLGLALPKVLHPTEMPPLNGADAVEAFAKFRRKKPATKSRLLTEAVTRLASIGLMGKNAKPFAEHIAAEAKLEPRRTWTPNAAFFQRLQKDQLLAIHQQVMGLFAPSAALAKQRKTDITDFLHRIFNDGPNTPKLPKEQQARVDAWLPEGLTQLSESVRSDGEMVDATDPA